ncbi:MAG: T9SS type A sorting domain-containing protein [Candidatus Aegiribacteria sp.]|nr:T9SS type A sorting domain-containing protein [Candidatus Aegiribacteria sp.]
MVFMYILLLGSVSISSPAMHVPIAPVQVGTSSTILTWECSGIQPIEGLPDGLTGYFADNCGFSGSSGSVLLPGANLYFAIPPGVEPELEIIPEGVHYLSGGTVSSVSVSPDGIDRFEAATAEDIPREWGLIAGTGTFRRAGYAHIQLHPVISRNGALYAADRFRILLNYPDVGSSVSASGISGAIFNALFEGGNYIWRIPEERFDSSLFWGLPWYALDIDTAGIYCITGADIPIAEGTPSASLSLYCGRGREMGNEPWLNEYSPRPVPILIDDGGDGIFDSGDRFFFFGRGLAWWEPSGDSLPFHFNHRFATSNTYWLTWGGEDGVRMNVQNGELTGAPVMPDSYLSRQHLEQNHYRTRGIVDMQDDWAWVCSESSSDTWHYFSFDAPGTEGNGFLKIKLISNLSQIHRVRIQLNGTTVCDTTWVNTVEFVPTVSLEGILDSGNSLSLQIIRDSGSDTVFLDWFEVFSWTDNSFSGQAQVPLEWWPVYDRQEFTWGNDLSDALVFLVSGDTLVENISVDDLYQFEFEVPASWEGRELWISDYGDMYSPLEVRYESPGRIIGSMDGARTIYVAADEFFDDITPLVQLSGDIIAVRASEVYDEFNGGVRDPRAIQAMVSYIIDSWDPIPEDLILVGSGNWDPLNFVSSRISYIDILYRNYSDTVSDDEFSMIEGSILPQIALSRMGIINRSDLQLIVDRSLSYRSTENQGDWQTVVLGAADDEKSPLHGGDEAYHTQGVERLLTDHLPDVMRPEKLYLIFYDWDSIGNKPQAREDYISLWSKGALVSLYLGHGSFDQLADEGLLYLEDNGRLACGQRLPVALFGSCDVGKFPNPSSECLAQQVTTSRVGGAILGHAATARTNGYLNEPYFACILDYLFSEQNLSVGMCIMLGKIEAGYTLNTAQYVLFGDGSLSLAFPWDSFEVSLDTIFAGEEVTLTGSAPSEGTILVESWESCQPDTYYTFRDFIPIEYLSLPSRFYSGTVYAEPGYTVNMFVPVDSDTGCMARTQLTFICNDILAAASTYPAMLELGNPLPDSEGPLIELWIEGYRNASNPEISGDIHVRAILSDSSGINLLGNVGRQLALYVDGTPDDVSDCFQYHTGSSTTGELRVGIGVLESGNHTIRLRASDGLLNSSTEEIEMNVSEDNSFGISSVFPYPNPCNDGTSINWTQSSPGKVDISVYTVTGRRLIMFGNIEGTAGYNQCWWDCRDADGDAVASGTYIYTISAVSISNSGENSEATGIIAVVRNP